MTIWLILFICYTVGAQTQGRVHAKEVFYHWVTFLAHADFVYLFIAFACLFETEHHFFNQPGLELFLGPSFATPGENYKDVSPYLAPMDDEF